MSLRRLAASSGRLASARLPARARPERQRPPLELGTDSTRIAGCWTERGAGQTSHGRPLSLLCLHPEAESWRLALQPDASTSARARTAAVTARGKKAHEHICSCIFSCIAHSSLSTHSKRVENGNKQKTIRCVLKRNFFFVARFLQQQTSCTIEYRE